MGEIRVEHTGRVALVTISNQARRNAISYDMWVDLGDVFSDLSTDRETGVVVLRGEGDDFCSGADLENRSQIDLDPHERLSIINRSASSVHSFPKPVIAAVRGYAYGAGLNLALGCDFVIADTSVRVSEIFIRRGLSVDFGGSWLLPRFVGLRQAMELALTGDEWGADQVAASGLFNSVVPPEQLDEVVADWTDRLIRAAPVAYRLTKSLLQTSFESTFAQSLDGEARCQALNRSTTDPAEGWAAFKERRTPEFSGRFR